jgi:selenocysteine lyase/cysteine desulfurase
MAAILPCQRDAFDIPDDVAYLNCAYMSPSLNAVVEAGVQGVERKARPWKIQPADFFQQSERVRALFAGLLAAQPDDVALVPSVSYGIATAAKNLPSLAGRQIVTVHEQFPSNIYPWRRLAAEEGAEVRTVPRPEDGDWAAAILEVLEGLGSRVGLVALPQCHWTDGSWIDLVAVGEWCRRERVPLVLDITQSAGAVPFSVREVDPDFVATAAYKWLLGPYSTGFLYVAPRHQGGIPLEENWITRAGSENFARLVDYQDAYQPGARRFDVGERSNFALLPMVQAALEQITAWGVENIAATLGVWTERIAAVAAGQGFAAAAPPLRAPHLMGLQRAGLDPQRVAATMAEHQVYVSIRGASIRVAPHLHVHDGDLERLDRALAACVQ